jgi:hypothetical protein
MLMKIEIQAGPSAPGSSVLALTVAFGALLSHYLLRTESHSVFSFG